MSYQYEQGFLNFDLNFLNLTSNNVESNEKTEDISVTKKKIVATDFLIRKYYETKEVAEELDKTLYTTREDSKKAYIEIQKLTEKNAQFQNEATKLHNENQELQNKCSHMESVTGAIQSHSNQLQILVKEKETIIESIKIENQLHQANLKKCEKNISKLQKENDILIRHICLAKDIIFGKKKLNPPFANILRKYNRQYDSDDNDSLLGEDAASDNELNTYHLSFPKVSHKTLSLHAISDKGNIEKDGKFISTKDDDLDSEFSNEHASADTGRGSSLAFSDAEKGLNSPDYFMDHSPMNDDIKENITRSFAHVATSPIRHSGDANFSSSYIQTKRDVSTSPLMTFNTEEIIFTIEPDDDTGYNDNISTADTLQSVKEIREKSFNLLEDDSDHWVESLDDVRTSSGNNVQIDVLQTKNTSLTLATDGNIDYEDHVPIIVNETQNITSNSKTSDTYDIVKEKECLELNNSDKLRENVGRDVEIEMILSTMRLSHSAVTPLPSTPSRKSPSRDKKSRETCSGVLNQCNIGCEEAIKARQEIKILQEQYHKLMKHLENNCLVTNNHKENQAAMVETGCVEDEDDIVSIVPQNHFEYNRLNESQENSECNKNVDYNTTYENNVHNSINKDLTKSVKKLEFEQPLPMLIQHSLSSDDRSLSLLNASNENSHEEIEDPKEKDNVVNSCNYFLSKPYKCQKLTKLQKFRQKLLPKTKIRRIASPPIKKLRNKHIQLLAKTSTNTNNLVSTLNDKSPYEKALKVMAELKSQQKCRESTESSRKSNKNLKFKRSSQNKKNIVYNTISKPHFTSSSSCKLDKVHNSSASNDQDNSINNKEIRILEDILITDIHKFNKKDLTCHKLNEKSVLTSIQNEQNMVDTIAPKSEDNNKIITLFTPCVEQKHINTIEVSKNELKAHSIIEIDSISCDMNFTNNKSEYTSKDSIFSSVSKTPQIDFERETTKCDEPIRNDNTDEKIQTKPKFIATRSKAKYVEDISSSLKKIVSRFENEIKSSSISSPVVAKIDTDLTDTNQVSRKRQKSTSFDGPEIACKRVLRSSTLRQSKSEDGTVDSKITLNTLNYTESIKHANTNITAVCNKSLEQTLLTYEDLDLFDESKRPNNNDVKIIDNSKKNSMQPKESILCSMLNKYGKQSVKNPSKRVPDSIVTAISNTIDKEMAEIIDVFPKDTTPLMKKFVNVVKKWSPKQFMAGLMEYLQNSQRKEELFNKISLPLAPPMTKSEQVLLYVIKELKTTSNDIVESVLSNIEYTLFKINRTPDFDTVETMSHFYAVVCRYFKLKCRLRLFMLDAMYCIQFKAVPLIKQCLEVWMHVLPLAHMGIARSPLVTCMVYLLHFYKCEDRFNRVQEIRNILHRKYYYEITKWNEPKILEMFKMAIINIRAIPAEVKLLRLALIVIAKRSGPKWCQKNIIKSLLLPIIEKDEYSEKAKIFCVSMLGPLLKPYPNDMKVHCEIVLNLFIDKLKQKPSPQMEEAIFTSLIYMSRHNLNRVLQNLLMWAPKHISPEFEGIMCDFVSEKPLRVWKSILSKIDLN